MYKHAAALCLLILYFVTANHESEQQLMDLSVPDYEIADSYNSATYSNLLDVAMRDNSDVNAMVALEHGQIVAEYYDDDFRSSRKFDLWSGTKAWTSLLFGVMEQEGLIHIHDTLGDIFSNASIWDTVEDADVRKNITIEHFLQMRAGLSMPSGWIKNDLLNIRRGRLGGKDFQDSLTYNVLDPSMTGTRHYAEASNLLSYVILAKTNVSPEDYAVDRVFDRLGIFKHDFKWFKNAEGLSTAFHGLRMTATAWLKLGMLYLQGGFVNPDEQVISQDWVDRTFTVGDENANVPFGYMWWIDTKQGIYCSKGLGGQRMCISPEKDQAIVVSSRNYDQKIWEWLEGDNAAPQDQLVDMFLGE